MTDMKVKEFPPYMDVWILVDLQDPARAYIGKFSGKCPAYGGSYYLSKSEAEKDMCIAILEGRDMVMHRLIWPINQRWADND